MKKDFLKPELTIQKYTVEDIIATSVWTPGEDESEGDLL